LLLEEGNRCWKVGVAPRAAVLIDVESYYAAALEAMGQARRSIHFLNWAFEPETRFRPGAEGEGGASPDIARFLKALAKDRPDLDIRILCWQSALPVAATQDFFPIADRGAFARGRVRFVLDADVPLGACHHQKLIVIDDAVAFCGGADIGQDRWDTQGHLDDDPRREIPGKPGHYFESRHEVMAVVDGPPAAALGELFRLRWRRRTGEALSPAPPGPAPWPASVTPMFEGARVGLSRTEPSWRGSTEIRECQALHLAAIAAARRCIYMENQYFTSELMGAALARRLAEPGGPEVVLISGGAAPSYFDRLTMDPTRSRFIAALEAADPFRRFRVLSPVTAQGRPMIVHAKLTIIDDRLLRVGSANLDNRSFGFDTECDLSLEADGRSEDPRRAAIAAVRTRLVAHWLGRDDAAVDAAVAREGSLCLALDALNGEGRLRPIEGRRLSGVSALVARLHLGDPLTPTDSFRPWRRRAMIAREVRAAFRD
jgi:phosphatidylserine/phosphatidylglycerophosphate/cardiolipin synthase-like enzyme